MSLVPPSPSEISGCVVIENDISTGSLFGHVLRAEVALDKFRPLAAMPAEVSRDGATAKLSDSRKKPATRQMAGKVQCGLALVEINVSGNI